jgi:hypothetical protein
VLTTVQQKAEPEHLMEVWMVLTLDLQKAEPEHLADMMMMWQMGRGCCRRHVVAW